MANRPENRVRLELDKVERKKLAEIKANDPSYKDLELYQVAHMELKTRLFERSRLFSQNKSVKSVHPAPQDNSPVVQRWTHAVPSPPFWD